MNRIPQRFARLRARGEKGLIIYLGAGDPDLATTRALALALDAAGVDVLELGVPFSDPLADGPVNQLAAQRGLASGTTPDKVLAAVADLRGASDLPLVLYLYYNLVHRRGLETFIAQAARAGVDGLLVLDLPPEEAAVYDRLMAAHDLCPIYLVAPTTPDDRIELITQRTRGFVYYVSREGVTGMQDRVADDLATRVARIRQHTALPVAVGFGISTPAQACLVAAQADAVVVGSAVVNQIARAGTDPELVSRVAGFVRTLVQAIRHP
jgi:tryptophan synthase alpha chain